MNLQQFNLHNTALSPAQSRYPGIWQGLSLAVLPICGSSGGPASATRVHELPVRPILTQTSTTTASVSIHNGIRRFRLDGTAEKMVFGPADKILPLSNCTIVLGLRKTDATNRDSAAFGVDVGTNTPRCEAAIPKADGDVQFIWKNGAGSNLLVSDLTFGDDVWGFTTGARGMEIWQNGYLRTSSATNLTRVSTSEDFTWGEGKYSDLADLVEYTHMLIWKHQMNKSQMVELTGDHYSSLKLLQKRDAARLVA